MKVELDPNGSLPDEYRDRLLNDGLLTAEDVAHINGLIEAWGNEDTTGNVSADRLELVSRVETYLND